MTKRRNPWLIKQARPATPPREKTREVVEVFVDGTVIAVSVIVWDTAQGPVLYFVPLGFSSTVDVDELVWQVCDRLLEREQYGRALLLDPVPFDLAASDVPRVRVHQLRRPLKRGDELLVSQVARTLRADLPVWIAGTQTVATAALTSAGSTLTVPDTTAWAAQEASLRLALQARFPELYPLAWAVLAVEGAAMLAEFVAGHERLPDRGEGWYLVARPPLPQPPDRLRGLLADAVRPTEFGEQAVAEVAALRKAAATDPRGAPYGSAAERLATLTMQEQLAIADPSAAGLVPVTATWAGPVVATWLSTLTPVADLPATLRLKRAADLLEHTPAGPGEVQEAYLDGAGRLVLVLADQAGPDPTPWMCAEWPSDATVAAGWADDTVLAADCPVPGAPAGPLLALTPGNGAVRIDPFPASTQHSGFAHRTFLRLLLKAALEQTAVEVADRYTVFEDYPATAAKVADMYFVFTTLAEEPGMTLPPLLRVAGAEMRLRWGDVRAAADADFARVQQLLAPDAPTIYQYFAVLPEEHSPVDQTRHVVRVYASPAGFPEEEMLTPSGEWERTFILDDIERGKENDAYRRLRPDEVASHIAARSW